jgi:hypothetical protein
MLKLEDNIKYKQIIDIDTAPNNDKVYSGMYLLSNSKIVMILNFDEENGEFNGFTIVQYKDIEKYRLWIEDEYSEIKNDNSEYLINKIDFSNFIDLESSLNSLISEFVAIFTYDDENNYFVGRVLTVKKDFVELHLVDEDGKWSNIEIIKLCEISYLGFDTSYEREIKKKALKNKSIK